MNKLLTKIVGVALGATMAVGVGVAAVKASDGGIQRAEAATTTVEFVAGTDKGPSNTGNVSIEKNGVTFASSNGALGRDDEYRLYAGSTTTFSVASGNLTSVTFNTGSSLGNIALKTGESGTYNSSTHVWTGNSSSVAFTHSAQAKPKKITVVYETSGPTTYSVQYDKNNAGASGTMIDSSSPYSAGATVTVKNNEFTAPSGMEFRKWNTASDGSGTNYLPNATFTINANTTLYAQWEEAVTAEYSLITDLNSADKVVITTVKDSVNYYLPAATTSDAPLAKTCTISNNKVTDVPASNLFTVSKSNGKFTFANSEGKYLGNNNSNNGVRINKDSSAGEWTVTSTGSNMFKMTNNSRWLGVYETTDWRSYTTSDATNYGGSGEKIMFYGIEKAASPLETIELRNYPTSAMAIGGSATLSYYGLDADGEEWIGNVTYTSSNTSVATVDSNGILRAVATGTSDITVYANAGVSGAKVESVPVTISVSTSYEKGTEQNPYTVSEAIAAITASGTLEGKYATGIICQIDSYNETHHSITYWISDDGTLTNKLEVYGGLGLNSEGFDSINDVEIGATVTVCGTLKKYGDVFEFDKNNYLTSYESPSFTLSAITGLDGELTADAGDPSWDLSVLTPKGNLTNGQTNVDISAYVDVTTSDVPGNPETTTTRKVSVTVTPKDQSLSALTQTYQVDGTINVLSGPVYTKVTNTTDLSAGDSVAIVAAGYDYAMSTTQGDNNRGQAAVVKNGNNATLSEDVQIFTLTAGTKTNSFGFYTGLGYIFAASSSKNYLRTEETLSDNSSFTIEIDENAVATLTAQGANTRNTISYNDNNNLFACYASTAQQKPVSIYKAASSSEYTAADFAKELLKQTKGLCNADYDGEDNHDALAAIWSTLSGSNYWGKVSNQSALKGGTADSSVVVPTTNEGIEAMTDTAAIGAALYRYDFCTAKYSLTNFMNRTLGSNRINPINKVNNTVAIVVVVTISLVSVSALGAYFLLRKKKEER